MNKPLFQLGRVVATHGAIHAMMEVGMNGLEYLARHVRADLDDANKRENDLSVIEGFRILSSYTLSTGIKLWLITEAD